MDRRLINIEKILAVFFLVYGIVIITQALFYPEPTPFDNLHLFYFPFPAFEEFSLYLYLSVLIGILFVALYGFFFLTKGKEFFQKHSGENIFEKIFFYSISQGFWAVEALVVLYSASVISPFFLTFKSTYGISKTYLIPWMAAGLFFLFFGIYKLLPARMQFIGTIRDVVLSKGPTAVGGPNKKKSMLAIISLLLFLVLGFFLFTEKIAITLNSKEICGTIGNPDNRDMCYFKLAHKNEDFSLCYLLEGPGWRYSCLYSIAIDVQDSSICYDIEQDYPGSMQGLSYRDECIQMVEQGFAGPAEYR